MHDFTVLCLDASLLSVVEGDLHFDRLTGDVQSRCPRTVGVDCSKKSRLVECTDIDLSHNCARDPEKNRANANVGQKIWREPRISSLFVWRNKRWRPCPLRFSGCSCAGLPIFQLRMASMSGQS